MELWIRSQNKHHLINVKKVWCGTDGCIMTNFNYGDYTNNELDFMVVGKYKNEKRAIEVLDEIQRQIENTFWDYEKDNFAVNSICNIYEMPKE